ncbi:calpain family cysteine peptidase [Tenggerimyces flavus]|uniref:Calpain catalytic domain-containing protein n=1 Tax=Tenggerimyces flavus TaxID=1708749 RepID=A0ABV7YDF6_9ACTN|nr:hypothetical protein [Tenggerimyces flavus]MBM7783338.1 hypothetical protein [Tenggerimyces flavus]
MSELRGHPDSPDPSPGADRPRPESAEFKQLESLAELRTGERKSYEPSDHAPPPRRDLPTETQTFERPGLMAMGNRIKQAITDRFGGGSDAEKLAEADDPREVHEIQRPPYTKNYYTDLPNTVYDRYLVRDAKSPIPLFDGPASRDDVRQGTVGDCGVLATLGAVAGHRPELIRDAVSQVGERTYEVTLHRVSPATPGDPVARPTGDTVTYRVNDELPVRLDRSGAPPAAAKPEICAWPALVEKALAGQDQTWGPVRQMLWNQDWAMGARDGVDKQRLKAHEGPAPNDPPTGYDRLNVGSTSLMRADLLTELTGEEAEVRPIPSIHNGEQALLDEFRDQLDDGKPVLVGSRGDKSNEPIPFAGHEFGHVYEVTDVSDGKIKLRNPWGDDFSPDPMDVKTFCEYFRNIYPDGSRGGFYTTLK